MNVQNRMLGWFIGAAGIMLLGGCVVEGGSNGRSISTGFDGRCSPGSLYDAGFEDGTRGGAVENDQILRRCSPNVRQQAVEAYRSGWDAGIALYCTEENGFVTAANGAPDLKTCPRRFSRDFQRGHRVGAAIFKENQSIAERSERLRILDNNVKSGRFSPEQLEVLLRDRRKVLSELEKDKGQLARQLATVKRRGYPLR